MSSARDLSEFANSVDVSGNLTLTGDIDMAGNSIQFNDATGILDSNGNDTVRFQQAASAVNFLNIGNHSRGNAPYIGAGGSDTNVDLQLGAKGSGVINNTSTLYIDSTTVTEPIWLDGGGNANGIMFDDSKQKRISWNDGGGNWTFRAGNYFNSGHKYVVTGDGASLITMTSDGADGAIQFSVAGTGTADAVISWSHSMFMHANGTFTYDSNNIHHDGDEDAAAGGGGGNEE